MSAIDPSYLKVTLGTGKPAYERTCPGTDADAAVARARRAATQAWSVILTPVGVAEPIPAEFLEVISVTPMPSQGDGVRQMLPAMTSVIGARAADHRDKGKPYRTHKPYLTACSVEDADDVLRALAELAYLTSPHPIAEPIAIDMLVDAGNAGSALGDAMTTFARAEDPAGLRGIDLDAGEAILEAIAAVGVRLVGGGQFKKSERWFGHTLEAPPSATLRAAKVTRSGEGEPDLRTRIARYLDQIGDTRTAKEILT